MEAALAREEARATARREAVDAMRRFDTLLSAGERRAALAARPPVPQHRRRRDRATAGGAHRCAAGARRRRQPAHPRRDLVPRGRAARGHRPRSRRRGHAARSRRCHAATPSCAREPTAITVEDAGSRGGIRVGGARVDAPLPLRGSGELGFGDGTTLAFTATEHTVLIEGRGGLDRSLRALVGVDPVSLAPLFPGADGAVAGLCRRRRPIAPAARRRRAGRRSVHRPGLRSAARRRRRDWRARGRCGWRWSERPAPAPGAARDRVRGVDADRCWKKQIAPSASATTPPPPWRCAATSSATPTTCGRACVSRRC